MKRIVLIFTIFLAVLLSCIPVTYGEFGAEPQTRSVNAENSLFYVLVNSSIYSGIESNLTRYVTDLQNEGYSVNVTTISGGSPKEIRSLLASAVPNGLVGVFFVGDIPEAWYEMNQEEFPIDLFYMDLDGLWADLDGDNMYDGHYGEVDPEIYVGRLKASNIDGDEVSMINNYFEKIHRYRKGTLSLPKRALVYVDDDWASAADKDNYALKSIYEETTVVNDTETTNAEDYKKRITTRGGYEWVHLRCHGNPTGHTFKNSSGWDGSVRSDDYRTIDPKVMFYQLYSCLTARYTDANNLASTIALATSYGLLAVGPTKPGAMQYFEDFYGPISTGKSIGTAFQEWFIEHVEPYKRDFSYGLTLIGDPTLKIVETGRVHDVAVTNVTISMNTAKVGDPLTITVGVENQGNWVETFDVTTYYDGATIGTQTVTDLAEGDSTILDFTWNTTDVPSGNYTIKAVASTLPGEYDTGDNTKTDGIVGVRLPRPRTNRVENSGWESGNNSLWEVSVTKDTLSQVSYGVSQTNGINGTFGFHVEMSNGYYGTPEYASQSLINFQDLCKATLDADTRLDYWVYPDRRLYGTNKIPSARWEVILFFSTGNRLHYYVCLDMEPTENSTDKYILMPVTLGEWNQFVDSSVLTTYTGKFGAPPSGTSIVKIAVHVTSRTYASGSGYSEVVAKFDSDEVVGGLQCGWPVQNMDTGFAYASIQGAINAPETLNGHTIQVYEGTYYEHVVVNKSLTIIGEDPRTTIIDGSGAYYIVTVQANNSTISQFTIQDSYFGVRLEYVQNSTVSKNIVSNNIMVGIWLTSSDGNVVSGNTISDAFESIKLEIECNSNIISDNKIHDGNYGIHQMPQCNLTNISNNIISNLTNYGIWIEGLPDPSYYSSGNNIINNTVSNVVYAGGPPGGYGLRLICCSDNSIIGNTLSNNDVGMWLDEASNNTIKGNTIINNAEDGINVFGDYNMIVENNIRYNGEGIQITSFLGNNTIHHNNFINNTIQISSTGLNNIWISTNNVGNYWSDYNGTDTDGNGIGDTLLPHEGVDWYPLMWKWFPGDLDGDGDVDKYDFGSFALSYGSHMGDPNYNPIADLDYDGDVDPFDFNLFRLNYGKHDC